MRSGTIPNLGKNRSHPSTSSLYVGGKFFCLVEVCPPFQVSIDPESGRAESGQFDDMDGRIEVHKGNDLQGEQDQSWKGGEAVISTTCMVGFRYNWGGVLKGSLGNVHGGQD